TMVRARAGGVGQVFNLGEMTLTRCVVQLFDYSSSVAGQPQPIAGFGYVAGRSHRHAELAAVCDGLLQHRDWHQLMTLEVLEPLGAIAKEENAQKQQRTAATKVDFFTMMRGE
ncbi:MAG: phosphonate C-P lyase system protein PhnG, partial [Cyanobacteria bacterium J06598_3]